MQIQKLARSLKFWILEEEKSLLSSSEKQALICFAAFVIANTKIRFLTTWLLKVCMHMHGLDVKLIKCQIFAHINDRAHGACDLFDIFGCQVKINNEL